MLKLKRQEDASRRMVDLYYRTQAAEEDTDNDELTRINEKSVGDNWVVVEDEMGEKDWCCIRRATFRRGALCIS